MKQEVAIIGMSMKVAGANNVEEFWTSVEKGEPLFDGLSDVRRKDIFDRFGEFEVAKGSYLDRVDLFDNEFFKISSAEAERMDPEQRLMMECAVNAVVNAGYQVSALKGQPIGIFHTFERSQYRHFFDEASHLSMTAHMPGMVGTRIANFMDWRGPVLGIDTTCSSSLCALYYACQSLANGDCSMALVGGASLGVSSKTAALSSPIVSKKQQCLPFDKDADGILGGEGVICIFLKKAEEAMRDGDPIHAIIKGGAINHGGALIQNISAPSPVAQAEVIRMAWENSKVDPARIGFIEAHGTGTILGDPIEFSGITAAFEGIENNGINKCAVSSVKGQIGHLGTTAGLVGLARLVLALRNKQLPAQPGFKKINDHINEIDSRATIQRQIEHWQSDQLRVGGVSSFGLTGTNVHMVVEEYPAPAATLPEYDKQQTYLLKIGGATAAKAAATAEYLKEYLRKHAGAPLNQLCFSVNKILHDHQYGQLLTFKDQQELVRALNEQPFNKFRKKAKDQQVLLLIPGILSPWHFSSFAEQSNLLATAGLHNEQLNEDQRSLLLHYRAAELLMQAGFAPDKIIGAQSGKLISLLLAKEITVTEAMVRLDAGYYKNDPFNKDGFIQFLQSLNPDTQYLLVMMGDKGELHDSCKQWLQQYTPANIESIFGNDGVDICMEMIAAYYNKGNDLSFEKLFRKESLLLDLHLPLFESKRFWPQVKPYASASAVIQSGEQVSEDKVLQQSLNADSIIEGVYAIWKEKLKIEDINATDDFFDLGGTSLLGLDVLQLIEKRFNVSLGYADIFDYCTIEAQAALIAETLGSTQAIPPSDTTETKQVEMKVSFDTGRRQTAYDQLIQDIKKQQTITTISPENILLTGGTGFLGAFVIKQLLTKTQAKINCLVRAETDEKALERLTGTLALYFPNDKPDLSRINCIKGDITQPGLDLSNAGNKHLFGIDTVYHLAANVSHFGKVELSNKINFEGTVNVLEWSKKTGARFFNHFSTNAVANGGNIDNVERINFYESDLDLGQNFGRRIYAESKFKAEQYIQGNKGGLHVNVFRIGNISGDSATGLFQQNIGSNNFYQRLKTLAGLGYYCDDIAGHDFETTPVDVVADIVTRLSLYKNEVLNTFHIAESNPIRLSQMIEQLAGYGIHLQKTDTNSFLQHVQKLIAGSNLSTDNTILGILKYGNNDTNATRFTIFQDATKAYLDKIGIKYTYDKEHYANTIIKYCIQNKFL